jgi:hypothetical protein
LLIYPAVHRASLPSGEAETIDAAALPGDRDRLRQKNDSGERLMSVRILSALSVAAALTFAAACSNDSPAPLTPSSAELTEADAAPDGSTLKVTAPTPMSPAANAELDDDPVFQVGNSRGRFANVAGLEYRFEVHTEGGQFVVNSPKVAPGDGTTSWKVSTFLDQGTYRFRSRAERGTHFGPWSEWVTFKIVAPPSILPPGPYPTNPEEIVRFVQRSYPDRGKPRVSLAKRKEDMAFLRDRIIEVGLCVGHEMGRNLKRGGPEHSYDFLAWKHSGKTWGVDIAGGYDALKKPLILSWRVHAPRAFFDPLPNPERCRN